MILNLFEYKKAKGTVIIIDVLRAFTTSSILFNKGVDNIFMVKDLDIALHTKMKHPDEFIIFGEKGGKSIKGFDYENSPAQMKKVDVDTNKKFIQRTSSGTRGAVSVSKNFDVIEIIAGAFTTADAIKIYIQDKDDVDYLITGSRTPDGGLEDIALAEYLMGEIDLKTAHKKVRESYSANYWIKNYEDVNIAIEENYSFIQKIYKTKNLNVLIMKKESI